MISKKIVAVCATLGVAISGVVLAAPAQAEPVSNSYAIVGSDTLEDVVNALVNGSNLTGSSVRSTIGGATLGSFDATGTPYIITKPNGIRFGRPNGSGDGKKALSYSIDGTKTFSGSAQTGLSALPAVAIPGQVDIARSSSSNTADAAGALIQVPFGRDAIAYAYDSRTASGDIAAISSLTTSQLQSIYSCTLGTVANPIGGPGGLVVHPVIPQSGSGTRKDFLKKIGVDTSGNGALASDSSCITTGQEHDATTLAGAGYIMPMSVSRWVAMNTGASYSKIGYGVLAPVANVGSQAVSGTGTSMVPVQAYYDDATWGRDTFLIVEYARVNPSDGAYDANLAALLDPSLNTSLTNSNSVGANKAGSLKKKFGFLAPSTTTATRIAATS